LVPAESSISAFDLNLNPYKDVLRLWKRQHKDQGFSVCKTQKFAEIFRSDLDLAFEIAQVVSERAIRIRPAALEIGREPELIPQ